MNREFPLASLLRLRARAEEQAAAELAAARRAQELAAARRADTMASLAHAGAPALSDDLAWLAATSSRATLAALLGEQAAALDEAGRAVDARAEQWTGARRDVRALERLEERHTEAWNAQEQHAEQVALDEVAARTSVGTEVDA